MDSVNKTLYIPLYGKAYVTRKGILLRDPKAEEIWEAERFPLKGKAKSKWLAYYMGMRSAVFDRWLEEKMVACPGAVILHLGCGMDSRITRVGTQGCHWYDVDFPDVIRERMRYYEETPEYHMVGADLREVHWADTLPKGGTGIVLMEGISMYLRPEERSALLRTLKGQFDQLHMLMDCYSEFAAKASKYKNPIRDVGVTQVYGLDDPRILEADTGITFVRERDMTPEDMICQLTGAERAIFQRVFAGGFAGKLYRLYEYR